MGYFNRDLFDSIAGSPDNIQFKILVRPKVKGIFYVDPDNGDLLAHPSVTGENFTATIVGRDELGAEALVNVWSFHVRIPPKFQVRAFERFVPPTMPNTPNLPPLITDTSEYISRMRAFVVGEAVRFAPIKLTDVGDDVDPSLCSFTIGLGAPPGLFIESKTGEVLGYPIQVGNFTVDLFAVNRLGSKALVETFIMVIMEADGTNSSNGPKGRGCNSGQIVDTTTFDNAFACDCSATMFSGLNCDVPMAEDAEDSRVVANVVVSVGVGLLVLCSVGTVLLTKYRMYRMTLIAFDFKAQRDRMIAAGEVSEEQARSENIPREIKRSYISMSTKIGAGSFGEVSITIV